MNNSTQKQIHHKNKIIKVKEIQTENACIYFNLNILKMNQTQEIHNEIEQKIENTVFCLFTFWFFNKTAAAAAVVIRGSHVTTSGGRFWFVVDIDGGFGKVVVTGRQTQVNIFLEF